jgi:hypothetical protein
MQPVLDGLSLLPLLPIRITAASLIHGNFEGTAQKKAYALVGAAAVAAAVGPNTDARHVALQVALLVPILAGLIGLLNSFGMMRLPDPASSSAVEGMSLG